MTYEDKIRKLLDLASSPNEYEAKLALDRARELMAKHCITLGERENTKPNVIFQTYSPPIRVSSVNFKYTTLIVTTIGKHFGVIPIIYNRNEIRLYSFESNLKLARYAFDAIFNQLNAAFKLGYSKERSITFTESFWYGAAQTIEQKFRLDVTVSNALIVYDPVKAAVDQITKGIYKIELNPASIAGQIMGNTAGNEVSIYKGINQITYKGNLLT